MNNMRFAALCARIFPELGLIYNLRAMEKDPMTCARITALYMAAKGITSGEDYTAFQAEAAEMVLPSIEEAKAGRAAAEKDALAEQVKIKHKKGAPLTEEELALGIERKFIKP